MAGKIKNNPIGDLVIAKESNYYPFGLEHSGYNNLTGNESYKYQYNGKELQQEIGMYDYGARFYMPDLGRWGVVDPLAEKYPDISSYAYVNNNPIMLVDPTGMEAEDWYQNKLTGGLPWEIAKPMWQRISAQFVRGASNTVHVFQSSGGVGVESVWGTVEYPILQQKGANIIYHIIP